MSRHRSWKRNAFYIAVITLSIYAATAFAGSFMAENGRKGCERGNAARHTLYTNANARITVDVELIDAIQSGPNAAGVRAALTADIEQAEGTIANDLTLSPETSEPWAADCEAAYPDPLPWP